MKLSSGITGANQDGVHFKGFNVQRDFLDVLSSTQKERVMIGDIAEARPGDPCPECGAALQESRGIEIGNIFHLGDKYSKSMDCGYLDKDGKRKSPIMGCYGIGVTRLLPSIIEEHHDDKGIIFPITVSPFQVHVCSLMRKKEGVSEQSDLLVKSLEREGIEVLYDDRDEKPGSQFADSELMGIPFRIVLSPKTLEQKSVELSIRNGSEPASVIPLTNIVDVIKDKVKAEYAKYNLE